VGSPPTVANLDNSGQYKTKLQQPSGTQMFPSFHTSQADRLSHFQQASCWPSVQGSIPRVQKAIAKPRAVLTKDQVVAIFQIKATNLNSSATSVARAYGVSEKAVRDIWTARTWAAETWHLDTSRTLKMKKAGRPVGRRDSKPRRTKCGSRFEKDAACASPSILEAAQDGCESACRRPAHASDCLHDTEEVVSWDSWEQNRTCTPDGDVDALHLDEDLPARVISIDEQLFDWELGLGIGSMSDPFEADWIEPA
jgi:hypothetical protein